MAAFTRWARGWVAEAVAPILPSRDLRATSAFYARLGYEEVGLWPEEYLIVSRGAIGLHFFHCPQLDPLTSIAGCYLYVDDADALHGEYLALRLPSEGIPRLHGPPEDADYGLREFAVVDADGNLLRIGSRLAESG
jgi:catechol 2,3-dioxygenase-like lactoylglutathione lyase family enzyme